MKLLRLSALCALTFAAGGCSTLTQGTTQEVYINTNPQEASCTLVREGKKIGQIQSTPSSVIVSKTKHDITIVCDKQGYQTASYINNSGWESGSGAAGIALDVVLTLGASSAIDSISGADNKYEPIVNITLVPNETATPGSVGIQAKPNS